MTFEEKLNRISILLEKLLLEMQFKNPKSLVDNSNLIDHPTMKIMNEFINRIKKLEYINSKIENYVQPYYMGIKEVKRISGLSSATLHRKQLSGEFPSKRSLGGNTVRWLSSEINEWINTREKIHKKGGD